jgi:hypothetical protein
LIFGYIMNAKTTGIIIVSCGAAILLVCVLLAFLYRTQKIPLPKQEEG